MIEIQRKTVVADGSFCQRTRVAGWAGAVIWPDGAVIATSGPLGACGSSNSAEEKALMNALVWAIASGYVSPGDAIAMATDSRHSHGRLAGAFLSRKNRARLRLGIPLPKQDTGKDHGSPLKTIGAIAANNSITIEFVLIPGHTSPAARRRSVLARVMGNLDRDSRAYMRAQRRAAAVGGVDARDQ